MVAVEADSLERLFDAGHDVAALGGGLVRRRRRRPRAAQPLVDELDGPGQLDEQVGVVDVVNVDEQVLERLAVLGEGLVLEVFEAGGVEGDEGQDVGDFPVEEGLGAAEGPEAVIC